MHYTNILQLAEIKTCTTCTTQISYSLQRIIHALHKYLTVSMHNTNILQNKTCMQLAENKTHYTNILQLSETKTHALHKYLTVSRD